MVEKLECWLDDKLSFNISDVCITIADAKDDKKNNNNETKNRLRAIFTNR